MALRGSNGVSGGAHGETQLYGRVDIDSVSRLPAFRKKKQRLKLPFTIELATEDLPGKEYKRQARRHKKKKYIWAKVSNTVASVLLRDISMVAITISTKYFPGSDPEKLMDVALCGRARSEGKQSGDLKLSIFGPN